MARGITLYDPQQRGYAVNTGGVQLQSALPMPGVDVGAAATSKAVDQLIGAVTKAGAVAFNQWRTAEVTEKIVQYHKDLAAYSDDYMENVKGKDAADAGANFETYADQRARQLFSEIEHADGAMEQMFFKQAAPTAITFTQRGNAYGKQERESYIKTQQAGMITSFQQFAAENYKDDQALKAQLALTKEQIASLNPGMDMTAMNGKLDEALVSGRIGSFIADGNLGAARALFTRDQGLLGDQRDNVAMRLSNAEMAALQRQMAAEARAERQAAKAEKLAGESAWKDVVDRMAADDWDGAKETLKKYRAVLPASVYASMAPQIMNPKVATSDSLSGMQQLLSIATSPDAAVRDTLPQVSRELLLSGSITKATADNYSTNVLKEVDSNAVNVIAKYFSDMGDFDPTSNTAGANAMNDYYVWAKNNPNATADQRYDMATTLNRQYSLANINKLTSQTSPYVSRRAIVEKGSVAVEDGAAQLIRDYNSGKITKTQFLNEKKRLSQIDVWVRAIPSETKAKK